MSFAGGGLPLSFRTSMPAAFRPRSFAVSPSLIVNMALDPSDVEKFVSLVNLHSLRGFKLVLLLAAVGFSRFSLHDNRWWLFQLVSRFDFGSLVGHAGGKGGGKRKGEADVERPPESISKTIWSRWGRHRVFRGCDWPFKIPSVSKCKCNIFGR